MTELIGRTSAGRVHVVRHGFEASKPLVELIEEFAGPHVRPRFLLRSTKEVYVDSVTYARGGYRDEDEVALAAIERAKRHPFIIGRAAVQLMQPKVGAKPEQALPPVAYRLAFLPVEERAFNDLEATLDTYPAVLPGTPRPRHYLFLDLAVQAAFYHQDRTTAEMAFKQTIMDSVDDRRYSATIADLRSQEVPLRHSMGPQPEHTEDKSA